LKPTLIVYGNCQAGVIALFLKQQPVVTREYDVHYWQNFEHAAQLSEPVPEEVVRHCQVLWIQFQQRSPFPANDLLPDDVQRQTFPPLDTNLLWPFRAHDALLSRPEPPDYPFGRFPYGDRILMEIADGGGDFFDAPLLYREREQALLLDPGRIARIEQIRLQRRDAACSAKMSAEIFEAYKTVRTFWTPNHPTWYLLSKLIEKLVLASFPASGESTHPYHRLTDKVQWHHILSSYQCPISETVAASLGLVWWARELRYKIYDKLFVNADEFQRLYIALRQYRRRPVRDCVDLGQVDEWSRVLKQQQRFHRAGGAGGNAAARYELGEELVFADAGNGGAFLRSGFSVPEPWGIWTIEPKARIAVPIKKSTRLSLWFQFQTFARTAGPPAGFMVEVHGQEIGTFSAQSGQWGEIYEHAFEIPENLVRGPFLEIDLKVENGPAPAELRPGQRPVGIGLHRMRLSA
jgi:hypothetical protein